MSEQKYDVVFRGDIVLGHQLPEVKQRLAQLFKIDLAKVDSLFSGRAVPLKRNLDPATAEKYKQALVKAGAQVSIKPAGEVGAKPAPRPAAKPAPESRRTAASSAKPVSKSGPSLKERLAAMAEESSSQPSAAAPEKQKQAKVIDDDYLIDMPGYSPVPDSAAAPSPSTEKPSVVKAVAPPAWQVKPMEGNLIEDAERPASPVAAVPDVDYGVADVGSDLLNDSEKASDIPLPDFDIDFTLADVGAVLGSAKPDIAPPPQASTANFDLAPVGSDMGQAKKSAPPPPPDTSNLSLAD